MISPGLILKNLGKVGTLSQMIQGTKESSKIFFKSAKNVLISPWSKFNDKTDANEWIKLTKIGAGIGLSTWSAGQTLRTHHDSLGAWSQTRNRDGSWVYSRAQSIAYAASAALPAAAMLIPGMPIIGTLAKVTPLAAVVPAALGWTMDQVQSLALADMNHPLTNLFRVGFDSYFIDNYDQNDPAAAGRSKLRPVWFRNVRPWDKWAAKKLFGIDYRVTEYNSFTPKESPQSAIVEKS